MDMDEESSLEEGEIRSSSSLEQSDAAPCQGVAPTTTGYFIKEELVSNLVQFLQAGRCRHIIGGIIKGSLEELSKFNLDNLDAFSKSSEFIGTTTIRTFGGNTSHWTAFCAALANSIHELTKICRPMTRDPTVHEKIVKWEAEFEKLKKLEQKESYIRHRVMKLRVNKDGLILEMYKKTAITIDINGGAVQDIQQQQATFKALVKELEEVASQRKMVSDRCDCLRKCVMQSDSDRLQREINAQAIHGHVCATLKNIMEKLEEPTLSL